MLTHLPWVLILGPPGELPRALLMGAGWVINLAVAEWIIRKRLAIQPAPPQSLSKRVGVTDRFGSMCQSR